MKHYNIPVFVPHYGCPHDCVFCSQKTITGTDGIMTTQKAKDIIDTFISDVKPTGFVEIAFFGGSFTGIPDTERRALLTLAKQYIDLKLVNGIRLSTRPDYISEEILDELLSFGVTAIELGVQSMDEDVLKLSGRGHSVSDVLKAVSIIKKYPIELGLQMMTGLPGDSYQKSVATAKKIAELTPDTVRIYPTLVIKGTQLCNMMESGIYTPWTVEETVNILADIKQIFDSTSVRIIRMGLQTTHEISRGGEVAGGPFHEAIGELAENAIFYRKLCELIHGIKSDEVTVCCNPAEISKVVGHKKCNVQKIKDKYNIKIKLCPALEINRGELRLME